MVTLQLNVIMSIMLVPPASIISVVRGLYDIAPIRNIKLSHYTSIDRVLSGRPSSVQLFDQHSRSLVSHILYGRFSMIWRPNSRCRITSPGLLDIIYKRDALNVANINIV